MICCDKLYLRAKNGQFVYCTASISRLRESRGRWVGTSTASRATPTAAASRVGRRAAAAATVRSGTGGQFLFFLFDVILILLCLAISVPGVHTRVPAHVALDTEAAPTAFKGADVSYHAEAIRSVIPVCVPRIEHTHASPLCACSYESAAISAT